MQLNLSFKKRNVLLRAVRRAGFAFFIDKLDNIVRVDDVAGNTVALHRVPFNVRASVEAELDPHAVAPAE